MPENNVRKPDRLIQVAPVSCPLASRKADLSPSRAGMKSQCSLENSTNSMWTKTARVSRRVLLQRYC
ncbi:hypothetical protein DTO166G4_730 [Paecilomyces variotii]|nr:hypothetical protein DTO166G4_730 [Paecilomyces variotii]KAJ9226512.1 hypothetical protein DTO169C6_1240 [Paecilomyces variotii]KAJ9242967.1 hypothetical protein DTO166G5_71 [Paecilomyces variotii]KAJ9248869.1 hypothetical protein DTO207G8_7071 [Paecilomyces variotii]KAJ9249170.1 hypothetical protein DTO195F2_8600 [Paecilomyces variotii]